MCGWDSRNVIVHESRVFLKSVIVVGVVAFGQLPASFKFPA